MNGPLIVETRQIAVFDTRSWRLAPLRTLKNIAHKKTPAVQKLLLDRFFPEKR
jgi:hypothetical protein